MIGDESISTNSLNVSSTALLPADKKSLNSFNITASINRLSGEMVQCQK